MHQNFTAKDAEAAKEFRGMYPKIDFGNGLNLN